MPRADDDQRSADLSAYLDGELDPARAQEIEQWLASSPEAQRVLADLRAVSRGLADLPRAAAPHDLSRTVRHAAERRALLGQTRSVRPWPYRFATRIGASAALVAACVIVGWIAFERIEPPRPAAPGVPLGEELISAMNSADASRNAVDGDQRFAAVDRDELDALRSVGYAGGIDESPVVAAAPPSEAAERADVPAAEPSTDEITLARAGLEQLQHLAQGPDAPLPPSVPAASPVRPESLAAGSAGHSTRGVQTETEAVRFAGGDRNRFTPALPGAPPLVRVVVSSRSEREYDDVLRTIDRFQHASNVALSGPERGAIRRESLFAAVRDDSDVFVQANPRLAGRFLSALERAAPQQVELSFSTADLVQVNGWLAAGFSFAAEPNQPELDPASEPIAGSDIRRNRALADRTNAQGAASKEVTLGKKDAELEEDESMGREPQTRERGRAVTDAKRERPRADAPPARSSERGAPAPDSEGATVAGLRPLAQADDKPNPLLRKAARPAPRLAGGAGIRSGRSAGASVDAAGTAAEGITSRPSAAAAPERRRPPPMAGQPDQDAAPALRGMRESMTELGVDLDAILDWLRADARTSRNAASSPSPAEPSTEIVLQITVLLPPTAGAAHRRAPITTTQSATQPGAKP